MELKDFVELGLAKADAVQTFWNYYLVVVTAIVGIYVSEKVHIIIRAKATKGVLVVLFMLFAASNLNGLLKNWDVREAISSAALNDYQYDEALHGDIVALITITPEERRLNIVFHLVLDLIMVLFIWFGTDIRRQLTNSTMIRSKTK